MISEAFQVPQSEDLVTTEFLATKNATANTTALDKARRIANAFQYPKNAWIVVGSIIASVAICHWIGLLWTYTSTHRHIPSSTARSPKSRHRESSAIKWSRLPIALTNVFRVVAFRWTIPIGNDHALNATEIFLVCAYVAIVYIWAFINCEYDALLIVFLPSSLLKSHYHTSDSFVSATTLTGQKLAPSYWANVVACVMASQFGIITALGMKNNIISCTPL
jgi:ferric-chelate reductase